MNIPLVNFPKIESPLVRKDVVYPMRKKRYLATTEMVHDWIYDDGVRAVDKLDGTSICVHVMENEIVCVDNREQRLGNVFSATANKYAGIIAEGIAHTIQRGWLKKPEQLIMPFQIAQACTHCGRGDLAGDRQSVYGELIGPSVNRNRHKLDHHLFVPFAYLATHCAWGVWAELLGHMAGTHERFRILKDWLRAMPSRFNTRMKYPDILAEGVVFHHPDGRMCKLRRDMFDYEEE